MMLHQLCCTNYAAPTMLHQLCCTNYAAPSPLAPTPMSVGGRNRREIWGFVVQGLRSETQCPTFCNVARCCETLIHTRTSSLQVTCAECAEGTRTHYPVRAHTRTVTPRAHERTVAHTQGTRTHRYSLTHCHSLTLTHWYSLTHILSGAGRLRGARAGGGGLVC
jgi:hypothetical protein